MNSILCRLVLLKECIVELAPIIIWFTSIINASIRNSCVSSSFKVAHTKQLIKKTWSGLRSHRPVSNISFIYLFCIACILYVGGFGMLHHSYASDTQIYIVIKKQDCFADKCRRLRVWNYRWNYRWITTCWRFLMIRLNLPFKHNVKTFQGVDIQDENVLLGNGRLDHYCSRN